GARHGADDRLVRGDEIVTAHAGRAGAPGGDDDDVRSRSLLVAVRPDDRRLEAEHGACLIEVERLPLGQVVDDVDEDDVGVVAACKLLRDRGAHVPCADHGHLPPVHAGPLYPTPEGRVTPARFAAWTTSSRGSRASSRSKPRSPSRIAKAARSATGES